MLSFLNTAYAFILQHQLLVWLLVSIVVLPLLRKRTPAEWVSLGERKPRVQGLFRMMRGAGFDPPKVLSGLIQFLTGRVRDAGLEDVTPTQAAALARQNLSDTGKSKSRIPPLPLLLILLAPLFVFACSGPQSPSTSAALAEARVVSHEIALGYCTVHRVATPLILVAEGVYPAMTIPAHIADAFCSEVLLQPDTRYTDSPSAHPVYQREYSLSPSGFTVLTR
jgi:hypothetical protein